MMASIPALGRRIFAATVGDVLDLALAQPHQILLSAGSIALMAQFAAHGGIVEPAIGYCIAIGVEWAYLRGLASHAKAPTRWALVLNWSAFSIVVLWGVLWAATQYKAIALEGATGSAAWWLSIAHVVPVAWLSLCAAMTHSAAAAAEAQAQAEAQARDLARIERQRAAADELQLEDQRKRAELARWAEGQRLRAELQAQAQAALPAAMPHADDARDAGPASINGIDQACPKCGTGLDAARWRAARRWGHCAACKGS